MLIRIVFAVFFVAVLVIGSGAVIHRGWQVTHRSDPKADITQAKPNEIVASVIAWVNESPSRELPAIAREVSQKAPWLPATPVSQWGSAAAGLFNIGAVTVPSWLSSPVASVTALINGDRADTPPAAAAPKLAMVAQLPAPAAAPVVAPAPAPAVPKPVAAVAAPAAPVSAPVAPRIAQAAPAPAPALAPVPAAPVPTTPAQPKTAAPAAPAAAAKPAPVAAPAGTEVRTATGLTLTQKGCAIGGLSGAGATLVIGPAEVAAWATGSVLLPATARLVGTVIGSALVGGCIAGALVVPSVFK